MQEESPGNPGATVAELRKRPGVLRRLYEWVLHWADTPYGSPALATVALAESSFFPIPPDPLLMALTLGRPTGAIRFATICTLASVIGGIMGYWIGVALLEPIGMPIIEFFGARHHFDQLSETFNNYGFLAILGAALTPIPYKVFTITAGACGLDLATFVAASLLGRGLRFYAVSLLVGLFGAPIRKLIDRYFNLFCFAFFLLIIAGFLVIKVVM